jgi:hypothetical protein
MLAAMGYEPMQPRGAWGANLPPVAAPEAATRPAPSSDARSASRNAPAPRTAPALPTPEPAAPPRASAASVAAFAAALRRAAGGGDVSALVDDLDRLRRDPAAKRALWPRLRALRRLQ